MSASSRKRGRAPPPPPAECYRWSQFRADFTRAATGGGSSPVDAAAALLDIRAPAGARRRALDPVEAVGMNATAYDLGILESLQQVMVDADFWLITYDHSRHRGVTPAKKERAGMRARCTCVGADAKGVYADMATSQWFRNPTPRLYLFRFPAPPVPGLKFSIDHTVACTATLKYGGSERPMAICPQVEKEAAPGAQADGDAWAMCMMIPRDRLLPEGTDEEELACSEVVAPEGVAPQGSRADRSLSIVTSDALARRADAAKIKRVHKDTGDWDKLPHAAQMEAARRLIRAIAARANVRTALGENLIVNITELRELVHILTGANALDAAQAQPTVASALATDALFPHALRAIFSSRPTIAQSERFKKQYKTQWVPPSTKDIAFLDEGINRPTWDHIGKQEVEYAARYKRIAGKQYATAHANAQLLLDAMADVCTGQNALRYASLLEHMYPQMWADINAGLQRDEDEGIRSTEPSTRNGKKGGKDELEPRPTSQRELSERMLEHLIKADALYGRHRFAREHWDDIFNHVYIKWNRDHAEDGHSDATDLLFIILLGQDQSGVLNGLRRLVADPPASSSGTSTEAADDDGRAAAASGKGRRGAPEPGAAAGGTITLTAADILQRYALPPDSDLRVQLQASPALAAEVPRTAAVPPPDPDFVVTRPEPAGEAPVQRRAWVAYLRFARRVDPGCPVEYCSIDMFARVMAKPWHIMNREALKTLPDAICAALLADALRHAVDTYPEPNNACAETARDAMGYCSARNDAQPQPHALETPLEQSDRYGRARARCQAQIIGRIKDELRGVPKADTFRNVAHPLGDMAWPDYWPLLRWLRASPATRPRSCTELLYMLEPVTVDSIKGRAHQPASSAARGAAAEVPWFSQSLEANSLLTVNVRAETESWLATWKRMF